MRLLWLLLLIPLTGCLQYEDDGYRSSGDFDLEGHLIGTSIWTSQARIMLPGTPVDEPEPQDPVGTPGMGDAHALSLPEVDLVLEVRAVDHAGDLDWHLHRLDRSVWYTLPDALYRTQTGAPATQSSNGTARIPITETGLWAVVAQGDNARSDPFLVAVDVRWEVTGTVYPQRASGDPAPSNYDEMTDTYTVTFPTTLAAARIQTYGVDELPVGTFVTGQDVDVGIWGADRTPIVCEGSGGDSPQETLDAWLDTVVVYDVSFAIGAMPDDCFNGSPYYQNQRQVRYQAVIETAYHAVLD